MKKTSSGMGGRLKINLLFEEERNKILSEFNNTAVEYPRDKTIPQLFEEQVIKAPNRLALVWGEASKTYDELNKEANQVAQILRKKGVKPDTIVGIMTEKSSLMIVGILGILKAGGAYLPIDLNYPKARINFMLEDSGATILLTQGSLSEGVIFAGEKIKLEEELTKVSAPNLTPVNKATDLAYVMYTSGSTGRPKGVLIEHRGVTRLVINPTYIELDASTVMIQTGSIAFDASTFEIWGALLHGGILVLADFDVMLNQVKLQEVIAKWQVNTMLCTTTLFNQLIQSHVNVFDGLQNLLVGGEKLSEKHVKLLIAHNDSVKLINVYGPTENTTFTTTFQVTGDHSSIPIGKPINNTQVYILKKQQLCGIKIPGELCIGGDGLARGYLNRPELTAEKFLPNPFVPGERMYHTGDLARWLPDGNIEFLGRMDHQVKIRGYRIELGEIENQLLQLPSVKETVVIDGEDKISGKFLCAYIVSEAEIPANELRAHLSVTLPDYMIPAFFVWLEKMPLMPNGKLDRNALPKPEGKASAAYVAPRNLTEEILVQIWGEVLGRERVGIYDNFFELGGHSLNATVVLSKIHKELSVELTLKELFQKPTISEINDYLSAAKKSAYAMIEPVAEQPYYEASSAGKRMWLLWQFDRESTGYNMPRILIIDGRLDKNRLEAALLELIQHHEALRTTFDMIDEVIIQRVATKIELEIEYTEGAEESIKEAIQAFIRPFDLNQGPLLRVGLIRVATERHYLMFDMHHIISDGVSMAILTREFTKLYGGAKLAKQRIGYKDFVVWQNGYRQSEKMREQEQYWQAQFAGELPVLNLPLDYSRPPIQSFAGDRLVFTVNRELTKKLNDLAKETGTTLYMVLLSAINILLFKYTGQVDIIVGSPIAGRRHGDLENMIGMFVNTLAMRNYPEHKKTYGAFLDEVKATALKAYEHQDYQFEDLIDKLEQRRDASRHPLFDVMFVLQNMDMSEPEIEGLTFTEYQGKPFAAKLDLAFIAVESEEELLFHIEYGTKLFDYETIQRLSEHLQNIFKAITTSKDPLLEEIVILSAAEAHKVQYEFNNTATEQPMAKTIPQLFAEQVAKTPQNVALIFEEETLTYNELNEKSDQLARLLQAENIKPNHIVGLMMEPGLAMIIGILGILKSGGAYLPIDPEYPQARIKFMLADSGVNVLLTQSQLNEKVTFAGTKINIEAAMHSPYQTDDLAVTSTASDLAYVIYTSGTTGTPKGVLIEQKGIVNTLCWRKSHYGFNEKDVTLQIGNYTFDSSVEEIFTPLISGSSLVLVNQSKRLDPSFLIKTMIANKVTNFAITPAFYQHLLDSGLGEVETLRVITIGGENIHESMLRKHFELFTDVRMINEYGPTENSVCSTAYEVTAATSKILIGKPISNTRVYIVDEHHHLMPIGVAGELVLSGIGLARGYLHHDELTREKFVPNPFEKGNVMYRTGDLARWLPDGNIEFLGRVDDQVKIRGFRIELGEIESQILKLEQVQEAVVLARKKATGDDYLCAYLVSEVELSANEIRQYLSATLPDYMIPSSYVELPSLPLTANKKVDRKALPEPASSTEGTYVAPKNAREKKLAHIWGEVLGKEKVGVHDNFFELGGHSLKATVIASRIHKELNVELPLKELFRTPTIAEISEYLAKAMPNRYQVIEPVAAKEYYETSSAAKRMWFLWQLNKESTAYNMPGVLIIDGNLDKCRLDEAFRGLVERHESLRTSFQMLEDVIVQKVTDVDFTLTYSEIGTETIDVTIKAFLRPFDLSQAPLLRAGLIKVSADRHYLLFDLHHIIADGVSMTILKKEFIALYGGQKLAALRIGYKDFAAWQNEYLKSEKVKEQKHYWLEQLRDPLPVLNLPHDYARPAVQSFAGARAQFRLDHELTEKLGSLARETDTTLYMVLLSAVTILLSKYTGEEDMIIGTPIAGRNHADLEGIIGIFVNTLVMRCYPVNGKVYADFLSEVKETTLKAYENQDYPFEDLIDRLNLPRDRGRNPLFDVMLVLQNIELSEVEIEGLKFTDYSNWSTSVKVDLVFRAVEIGNEIALSIDYGVKLFKHETIELMGEYLLQLLEVIATDKSVQI